MQAKEKPTLVSSTAPEKVSEQIGRRAYELYEARGREDGHDLEDWLRAEEEITGRTARAVAA
jgi:Protein of unknown function (DUF2934)